ncbi:MAG: hypothetical protein IJT23_11650 [Clostridia bacterium]|nr:hypothetical protein [Clostridia bacterium]
MDGTDEQLQAFRRRGGYKTANSQLNLFDIIDKADTMEDMQREAERINNIRPAFSVPQQIVDIVLCDGTNLDNSILAIVTEFSKDKSIQDKVAFLKEHYETDGKGFILEDKQISAWWNEDGISIGYGETVETGNKYFLSWENAAKRIDELLDMGRFASADIILQTDNYIYTKTAEILWYMYRDLNHEGYPELKDLFGDKVFERSGGFQDDVGRLKEFIKTSYGLDFTKTAVQKICDMYDKNKDIVRFKYTNPHKTNHMLADLYIVRKQYTAQNLSYVPPVRFITEDEITKYLLKGTGVHQGKYRTYIFFSENSDIEARQQFLKNEYGIGGTYSGYINENHDGKGISISHGDIMEPYAKTLLKWNEVAKRIDKLIKKGIYFDKSEIDNISAYEKEQIANAVRDAFADIADEAAYRPFPKENSIFDTATISYITEKLDDSGQLSQMITELGNLVMETPKGDTKYSYRAKALEMLKEYSNGTFNLFPGIKRPVQLQNTENNKPEKRPDKEQESFADFYKRIHSDDDGKTVALFQVGDFY